MVRATTKKTSGSTTSSRKAGRPRAVGGCLCGAVRYEVRGPLREVVNCHCGQCRRFHGHFGAYTNAATSDISITGYRHLKWYRSSSFARRGFCKECGSSLFWERMKSGSISIAAGTLDIPTRLKTIRHIFVDHMGDYYKISDRLQKLPGTMASG
jgi:hypothetical protein